MIPVSLKAKCIGVMKHDPHDKKAGDAQLYCVSLKFEKTPEVQQANQINLVTAYGAEFRLDAEYSVDISFLGVPEGVFPAATGPASETLTSAGKKGKK